MTTNRRRSLPHACMHDGTWESTIERHGGYQFIRQATSYVVMMLIDCGVDFNSTMLTQTILHVTRCLAAGKVQLEPGSDIATWPTRDYLLSFSKILDLFNSSDIEQMMYLIAASEEKAKVAEEEFEKSINQVWKDAKTTITVLKVTVALLALVLPILTITLLYFNETVSLELYINILGVYLASWGIFIAIFINYGKIKSEKYKS